MYEKNFFYPLVKHRAYDFSEYVASVGGLLGLIAGISTVSFIELGFHMVRALTSKALVKVHPRRRKIEITREAFVNNEKSCLHKGFEYFSDFMKSSSIHGFSYTTSKQFGVIEKLFWSACVITSTIFCVILVTETTKRSELNPTSYGIDSKIWNKEDVRLKVLSLLDWNVIFFCFRFHFRLSRFVLSLMD